MRELFTVLTHTVCRDTHKNSLSNTHTHSHICRDTHKNSLSHTHTHTYAEIHTKTLSQTHTHTHTYAEIHTRTLSHTHTLTHMQRYTHELSLSHTHTHTHTQTQRIMIKVKGAVTEVLLLTHTQTLMFKMQYLSVSVFGRHTIMRAQTTTH